VAGSNHQSLEGLNGCTIVDEVHVIDSRTAHAIEHAGISRSEWMRFEISTAGSNLNGYGWQQWQYGEKVNRGEIKDPEFFFLKYAADSKLTDEQLEDPKVWREANPSMGTIISEAEFAKSLTRAKRSLVDWQNFKKGGLDLSRTRDMTAFVLVFDEGDGTFACLPYFWYPESAARKNDHQTPYLEWANQGYVDLIPGDVIKYDVVEDAICELAEKFIITEIVYDRLFAEDVTLRIENRVGCLRTNFPQTVMHFAGPTAETERLVTAGDLRHNNNPVLNWQAQNVKVKSDVNNNLRPVKPKNNNPAKIDGMVALIMAIGRSIAESEPEITYDFYDHNEVELI
jgi:phage terminase large subunit-like protein